MNVSNRSLLQKSYTDYRVGVQEGGKYKVVLNTDSPEFGGHARIDESVEYFTTDMEWNGRANFLQVYIPSRVALVSIPTYKSCGNKF